MGHGIQGSIDGRGFLHEFTGRLIYLYCCPNIRLIFYASQLSDAEEFIDGAFAGNLGEILIRCNNVMYMREAVSA